jgi:polyphosphate kinase 2 (PPK2 family)
MAKVHELSKKGYEKELRRLQVELLQLEEWIRHRGLRVVVIFEGRDTAGKGGVIKRMTALLNPRYCRVVACRRPPRRSARSGTSSATSSTSRRRARWCCSIAAGTTAPASSA